MKKPNIVMIVPVKINDRISRMEGLNEIPTVGKEPRVRPSYMNKNMGVMDMFNSEHAKK